MKETSIFFIYIYKLENGSAMRDYLIKPLVGQPYPMISHGKGVYLYDQMAINILMVRQTITAGIGHGVKEIADVIKSKLRRLLSFMITVYE